MSSIQAPAWALLANAIDGIGDTHLPSGIHVRALPSPRLGVPATPLVVSRSVLGADILRRLALGTGVTWIDSNGKTLAPPFGVTPDNPVYGYFPEPDVVWAELSATPSGTETTLSRTLAARTATSVIRFEALANSGLGPMPFQSVSRAPYNLAAWTIPLVRVTGSGTVNGMLWLNAARAQRYWKESLWETWSLPVEPAPRYTPTPNARIEAQQRVDRAGVLRQPMYVAYGASSPAAAPPATGADALQRIAQVQSGMDDWLKILLHDLSKPTWELYDKKPINGPNGGDMSVPIEPFLIAGSIDPDMGHYLGLGDVDQKLEAAKGSLVLYRIRGLWRWFPKQWSDAEAQSFQTAIRENREAAIAQFDMLKQLEIAPTETGPFVDLHTLAVALVGLPPDAPAAASIDATEDNGWQAAPPPDVLRGIQLIASGFAPNAVAALAAKDQYGDRSLHRFPKNGHMAAGKPAPPGTPLPMVVTRPADAMKAGQARFADWDVPPAAVTYRLAQGDWFGRWSSWTTRTAPAKERTIPMRPVIEIYPQPPVLPEPPAPMPQDALCCEIELRIPIPGKAKLPPGGSELASLELFETFGGVLHPTLNYQLANPAGASIFHDTVTDCDILVIKRTGPALLPCEQMKVSYTARWIDVSNKVSPDALAANRTIVDPRAPASPKLVETLTYTSRPDAQGHARVDLQFPGAAGVRYRVFASNETILLKALENMGPAGMQTAEDIRNLPKIEDRAAALVSHKQSFDWNHFECLTKQPIIAVDGMNNFIHRVSGSLEVAVFYRVVGEGPSGALAEITQSDMASFGVPNLGGPSRPLVSVLNAGLDPLTEGVKLRVKVPAGKAKPMFWRLRRTNTPGDDPLRMMIVDSGPVIGLTEESDSASFDIFSNPADMPLKAWRQYRFAVEVQGQPPSGSVGLNGEWSEASAAAKLSVIPPDAPLAPGSVTIQNVAGELHITVAHPAADSLMGTSIGLHAFEVWRVEPGKRPAKRDLVFHRDAGDTWVGVDPDPVVIPNPNPIPAIYVTVRIIDPVGRSSDATLSNRL